MKIVNIYSVNNLVNAKELYQFVKQYYEFIDGIQISVATLLDDLHTRDLFSLFPCPPKYPNPISYDNSSLIKYSEQVKGFFSGIFSNDHYKLDKIEISTPEIVNEIHDALLLKNSIPSESFIDICHHYSIPIFLYDFSEIKHNLFNFNVDNWKLTDWELIERISQDYYPFYYSLKDTIDQFGEYAMYNNTFKTSSDPINKAHIFVQYSTVKGRFNNFNRDVYVYESLNEIDKVTTRLQKYKSEDYVRLYEQGYNLSLYTENSLTYLGDEL